MVKLIIGVAMQSENSNTILSQITSLDKDTQNTLMQLMKDVFASMQPEGEMDPIDDDGPLKTFDEILQEYPDMDDDDEWHDWDADSPLAVASGSLEVS